VNVRAVGVFVLGFLFGAVVLALLALMWR